MVCVCKARGYVLQAYMDDIVIIYHGLPALPVLSRTAGVLGPNMQDEYFTYGRSPAPVNQLGSSPGDALLRRITIGPAGGSGAGLERILSCDWTRGAWLMQVQEAYSKFRSWLGRLRSVCWA